MPEIIPLIREEDRNLVDEIHYFWKNYDPTTIYSLSDSRVKEQIQVLLDKGRILAVTDREDGSLLGYVESWRINYEQFGRIICQQPFNVLLEDINNGTICYLSNITIHPDHRRSTVINTLKDKFFLQNNMCEYFVGEAKRKKTQPLKVFTRQEYYMKYMHHLEEVKYG